MQCDWNETLGSAFLTSTSEKSQTGGEKLLQMKQDSLRVVTHFRKISSLEFRPLGSHQIQLPLVYTHCLHKHRIPFEYLELKPVKVAAAKK